MIVLILYHMRAEIICEAQNRPPIGSLFHDCVFYENECSRTQFILPNSQKGRKNKITTYCDYSPSVCILYCFLPPFSRAKNRICPISTGEMTICTIIRIKVCALFFRYFKDLNYLRLLKMRRLAKCTKFLFLIWVEL